MWRYVVGFVLGFLMAAALALGATAKPEPLGPPLHPWAGEGRRPGLYYASRLFVGKEGEYEFWQCKRIGPARIIPPGPQP